MKPNGKKSVFVCRVQIIREYDDVVKLYNKIDQEYNITKNISEHKVTISSDKNNQELGEWRSLINFLKKNETNELKCVNIQYPYKIHKNESPDFVISTPNRDFRIEIARTITQNLARLYRLSKQLGRIIKKIDFQLFRDEMRIRKSDLLLYLEDYGNGYSEIGFPRADIWANVIYLNVEKKLKKKYMMDILLIDDYHIITSSDPDYIKEGIKKLKCKLLNEPLTNHNINLIISDNPSGFAIIYNSPDWVFKCMDLGKYGYLYSTPTT